MGGCLLGELSIFIDESGSDDLRERNYIVTLVLHEQIISLTDGIRLYEQSLRDKGLADIPFHAGPLLTGHDAYKGLDLGTRKSLFSSFRVFFRHLPIRYATVVLRPREYEAIEDVAVAMRREIVNFLFDNLEYLQGFDEVKIYYDNGQKSIAQAVHKAIDYVLSKNAITYRMATPAAYRLSQVADYICTVELTALKYQDKAITATDEKFFGSWSQFKKGVLKEVRAKRMQQSATAP